jgi:hypothetical protein
MDLSERNRADNQTISIFEQCCQSVITWWMVRPHDGEVCPPQHVERLRIGAGEGTRGDDDGLPG